VVNNDGSHETPPVGDGPQPSIPAMPSVPRGELYRGMPFLLLDVGGLRHSLGWQDHRKAGPSFVVARLSRLGTINVKGRFPLTEQGWANAWRALSGRDASAAAAVAAVLLKREAAGRKSAALAALDAESLVCLRRLKYNGGSGGVPLAKGQAYDLRFLGDRIMVSPPGLAEAIVELPYRDIETLEVGGPGRVDKPTGEVLAVTLAVGLLGAVLGLFVLGLLGFFLGALIFGLVGALVGAGAAKTETIVRIRGESAALYFVHTERRPEALRMQLSEPLRAIRIARGVQAGDADELAKLGSGSISDQLSKLASLLQQDLITRDEFEQLKARLIAKP
jgi:Short C-terminal domain